MLTAENIYLSYHNIHTKFAARLTTALYELNKPIWFDRFKIHPSDDWASELSLAQDNVSYAIVIVGARYLSSHYCLQEYRTLHNAGVQMLGIIVDDVSIDDLQSAISVIDWIDLRNVEDDISLRQKVLLIAEQLEHINNLAPITKRNHYLYQILSDLESRLADTSTFRALCHETVDFRDNLVLNRPRGYDVNLLREWHLTSQVNQATLDIEDILTWYDTQRQFTLVGKLGSGKTIIASLLTIVAVHEALSDTDLPLPIWLDLALWKTGQTLEDYIDDQWPLDFEWQEWLDDNEALLIFDNLDDFLKLNPYNMEEFSEWLATQSRHKIIVLSRIIPDTHKLSMQTVEIGNMPNTNIQRFGRVFLLDKQIGTFKRLVYENKDHLQQRSIDFISCGLELISSQHSATIESWFIDPVEALILMRWKSHFGNLKTPFSDQYFVKALRILAWHMMQQPYETMVRYEVAEKVVFRKDVINVAVDLGILETLGDYVRFHAQMYAIYLCVPHLIQDGLYVHVTHPRFDKDGNRRASRWDDVVVALIDSTYGEHQSQIISHLLEIDPYLVHNCIQSYPELYDEYFETLLINMIDVRSHNTDSHMALVLAMRQMPDMYLVATILLQQLQLYNWNIQQWLWLEFLKLPLEIPPALIHSIRTLDREFDDVIFDLLSDYSSGELTIYLALLMSHQDAATRLNAIWIIGRLKYQQMIIGLLNLLDHHTLETKEEAQIALSQITTVKEDLLGSLLTWVDQHPKHMGIIGTIFYQNTRYVTGRLLMESLTYEIEPNAEDLAIFETSSEIEIASYVATHLIATNPKLKQIFDFLETFEMNIPKFIQVSLEQLPRESLNRLIQDVQRVFITNGDIPETSSVTQRAQLAIESSRPSRELAVGPTSPVDDVEEKLQHDDWLVRLHATELLGQLPTEQALSLILQATNDSDVQVRVTAFSQLVNFVDRADVQQKMIETLTDDDSMVVDLVADLLKSSDILDTPTLIALLATDNVQQLAAVLDILCSKKDSSVLPHLVQFLDDNRQSWMDKSIADYAKDAIRAIGTPEALAMLDEVESTSQSDVEAFGVKSVEPNQKKTYTVVEKIELSLKVLRGDDWGRAQKVARFIRELARRMRGTHNPAVLKLMCEALTDEYWHVRWAVAEALGWLQDSDATPFLINVLDDDHWIVQVAVIRALAELDASDYVTEIATLLDSPNNVVRETVVETLGDLGNADAIPYLNKTLVHEDEFVRMASIKSLDLLQGEINTDHLYAGLHDNYIHVRWYAMEQLCLRFTPDDIPLLAQLLDDIAKPAWEDKRICDLAYEVLHGFDTEEAHQVIKDWQQPNSEI